MTLADEVLDELEALRAIYSTDFEDFPPEWSDLEQYDSIWGMPTFSIKVRPLSISVSHRFAEAHVRFTLTKGYPKTSPQIFFDSCTGLSAVSLPPT